MKNNIKKNFTQIPNDLINDFTISRDARFLFVYLCSKPEDWIFRAVVIEKEMGFKEDTRRKYTKELMDKGWITVFQEKKSDGSFGSNEIELNPYPIISGTVDNPPLNFSGTEFSRDGKSQALSNNDLISNTNYLTNTDSLANEFAPALFDVPAVKQPLKKEKKETDPEKAKVTLFKNSSAANKDAFNKLFENEIAAGIDMDHYYDSVHDWSETKQGIKRTASGWNATVRNFIRGDNKKNNVKFVQSEGKKDVMIDKMKQYLEKR